MTLRGGMAYHWPRCGLRGQTETWRPVFDVVEHASFPDQYHSFSLLSSHSGPGTARRPLELHPGRRVRHPSHSPLRPDRRLRPGTDPHPSSQHRAHTPVVALQRPHGRLLLGHACPALSGAGAVSPGPPFPPGVPGRPGDPGDDLPARPLPAARAHEPQARPGTPVRSPSASSGLRRPAALLQGRGARQSSDPANYHLLFER